MKSIKYLVILLVAFLLVPFAVYAVDEEVTSENPEVTTGETDNRVPVYIFRGEGCPHCEEALTWFSGIEAEYGSKYKIVDYETWYNEENADLMQKVAKARGEEAEGVPYIIIGDKSWSGFSEADYAEEIKSQIDSVYAQAVDQRYDVMKYLDNPTKKKDSADEGNSKDALILVLILIIAGAAGFGVYMTRKTAK